MLFITKLFYKLTRVFCRMYVCLQFDWVVKYVLISLFSRVFKILMDKYLIGRTNTWISEIESLRKHIFVRNLYKIYKILVKQISFVFGPKIAIFYNKQISNFVHI